MTFKCVICSLHLLKSNCWSVSFSVFKNPITPQEELMGFSMGIRDELQEPEFELSG